MDKIKIMTETTSDINVETAKEYGIHLVSQNIIFENESFKDKFDITCEEFYKRMRESEFIPSTSQITVADHVDAFEKYADEYSIIYITLSSKASGTYQSAHLAKEMILEQNKDADITIIDSTTLSFAYGKWVIEAAKMANEGKSKEEIIETVTQGTARTEAIFFVDTLNYLKKGGRISAASKVVADVLDIKPILTVCDGLVVSKEKVRGSKKLMPRILEIIGQTADDIENQEVIIMHGDALDKANEYKDALMTKLGVKKVRIETVGATVGTHAGPGVIGIIYIKKV